MFRDKMFLDKGFEQIKRHEGLRLNVYRCPAGKWTIGYGRNLEDRGITLDEANMLLKNDVLDIVRKLHDRWPWVMTIGEAREWVLINMVYNIGIAGLSRFEKFLGYLKEKKYLEASEEMKKSRWYTQVTKRAEELSRQIVTGKYQ